MAKTGQEKADPLKDYWVHGPGAAKIGWGTPGDFDRCVAEVTVHAPGLKNVKGYCADRHHDALGVWPGQEDKKAGVLIDNTFGFFRAATEGVTVPFLSTIPEVELIAAGTWPLSTGEATFTPEDLAAAVAASKCPAVGSPVIKLGHTDARFDGEPAVGRVANMALSAEGNKIVGDLTGMPGWLGAVMASAFPSRSIEGCYDWVCQVGHVHPFVITGLALLGVTGPGVGVLSTLNDVAALYGVQAAASTGSTWTLKGASMTNPVMAAGVTTEDVRRAYYALGSNSYSMWITEMQLSPPQLIVCNETDDTVYRVPVTIKGTDITFGDAVQVQVEYQDVAAARSTGAVLVFASAAESREGVVEAAWNATSEVAGLGDDPSASLLKAMFAIPGDTKSDSKLPHHDAADGKVGAANPDGCSAAIAAINGAHGGITGVDAATQKKAYDHLSAHLTSAGQTAPDYSGPAVSATQAAAMHDPYTGTHSHGHPANGSQGGDATHEHEHTHSGDADHGHSHASAAGPTQKGVSKVDFTDEQNKALRAALGLKEDDELTPELIAAGTGKLAEQAAAKLAASGALPPGVITVDKEAWEGLNKRVEDGEAYQRRQAVKERDTVIAAAIKAGKFSKARSEEWARNWDLNPEGTRAILAGLKPNVVPVDHIGVPGGDSAEDVEDEYRALFGNPA
jgi:hypothetical protein